MNYDAAADDDDDDCSLCYVENVNILSVSLALFASLSLLRKLRNSTTIQLAVDGAAVAVVAVASV